MTRPAPSAKAVAFFVASPHLNKCLAVLEPLLDADLRVVVFGDVIARSRTTALGAEFVDLHDGGTVWTYDDSDPATLRHVTFAGEQVESVAARLRELDLGLVISDSLAVIGRAAARAAGLPHVLLHSGHNGHAGKIAELERQPETRVSRRCAAAVDRLRDRYGFTDASPFMFAATASPLLNLYPEPAPWLEPELRAPFQPVRFFGSLRASQVRGSSAPEPLYADAKRLRIYAAFGAGWGWVDADRWVLPALHAIIDAVQDRPELELAIGMGGNRREEITQRAGERVHVFDRADQWNALAQADVFITHHGLKSTHEAAFWQVPMVSCPLFDDQPWLARICQQLGLAVALTPAMREPFGPGDVITALERVQASRAANASARARAHQWEQEAIAGRDAIVAEIVGLARGGDA